MNLHRHSPYTHKRTNGRRRPTQNPRTSAPLTITQGRTATASPPAGRPQGPSGINTTNPAPPRGTREEHSEHRTDLRDRSNGAYPTDQLDINTLHEQFTRNDMDLGDLLRIFLEILETNMRTLR